MGEDRVFSDFCKKIGVKNIRQYEERAKKKLEFENQINRITVQLEYEQKREEQLRQNCRKNEIDKELREVEKLKSERTYLKEQVDKLEEDVDVAKKEVSGVQKELASINKAISQLESSLENERSNRHTILKQCKMDSINIPMRRGRLEEIEDEDDPSIDVNDSQPSHVIYEREEKIKIDYNSLNSSLKECEEDDVRRIEKRFEKTISDLMATIHRIQAPNMKAMQKLDEAREKLQEANKDFETVRKKAKTAKNNFERIKQ